MRNSNSARDLRFYCAVQYTPPRVWMVLLLEKEFPKMVFVAANLLPKMLLFADRPLPSLQSAVTATKLAVGSDV